MFDPATLRNLIRQTLQPLNLWSANAEELLLATCAQESAFGTYRQQIGGPALGIFQMEPEDFNDIWANFLKYKVQLALEVRALSATNDPQDLINNDAYAIAMCRVHYERMPGALPDASDLNGLWQYYKQHYNTPQGAATQTEFYNNYHKYVTDGQAT